MLWENIAGKSCGKILREKYCGKNIAGKILRENLEGKYCGKILWENIVGKYCGKILWENLAGKYCGKILWENLVGKSEGNFSSWMLIGYVPITQHVNLCKLSLSIKGRNIFENNQLCFGNWWGKFIKVFIEWTLILFTPVGFTPSVIKNCKSNLCN